MLLSQSKMNLIVYHKWMDYLFTSEIFSIPSPNFLFLQFQLFSQFVSTHNSSSSPRCWKTGLIDSHIATIFGDQTRNMGMHFNPPMKDKENSTNFAKGLIKKKGEKHKEQIAFVQQYARSLFFGKFSFIFERKIKF